MTKDEKKAAKKKILMEDIETFIADHEMSNHHYLRDDDIIKAFPDVKPKKIKKVLKDIR